MWSNGQRVHALYSKYLSWNPAKVCILIGQPLPLIFLYKLPTDMQLNFYLIKIVSIAAPPKFVVAHSGPVTGRTKEPIDLVCEAVGDDHIR